MRKLEPNTSPVNTGYLLENHSFNFIHQLGSINYDKVILESTMAIID